jgi:catechol 2,3-dioxygenase-like lactoylglutathione lyase family enzyme
VLHHVGIEIEPREIERAVEFWTLLGFVEVEPPAALADSFSWMEKDGTQIHLMHTDSPTVPPRGHIAVVTPSFEEAVARLREHGFEVEPRREHWGSPRAGTVAPGGHRVELMKASPP